MNDFFHFLFSSMHLKPKFLTAANHDSMLRLGCDCGVCFYNKLKAGIVKKITW